MSLGLDECKQRVRDNLAFKLRLARGFEDYASPRRLKQLKAAHRAIQRDTLAAVEMFFVKDEAARQSSGLAAAEIDRKRASAAEGEAMAALCAYRCRTLAETRLRGAYLGFRPSRRRRSDAGADRSSASILVRGGLSRGKRATTFRRRGECGICLIRRRGITSSFVLPPCSISSIVTHSLRQRYVRRWATKMRPKTRWRSGRRLICRSAITPRKRARKGRA